MHRPAFVSAVVHYGCHASASFLEKLNEDDNRPHLASQGMMRKRDTRSGLQQTRRLVYACRSSTAIRSSSADHIMSLLIVSVSIAGISSNIVGEPVLSSSKAAAE